MKIEINKDQNIFFTSDTHYGHSNICSATTNWKDSENLTRKFYSLGEMNSAIVNNINSIVSEDDILFHLGDWSFGGFEKIEEFRTQIQCKNIHLILGNHDHHIRRNKGDVQKLFSSVNDYLFLDIRQEISKKEVIKYQMILCHYPIASWDGMSSGTYHLHGHVHLPEHLRVHEGRAMDVGVDGNGLEPISLRQVVNILKNRPVRKLVLPKDHHEKNL